MDIKKDDLTLLFDPKDYVQAKHFIAEQLNAETYKPLDKDAILNDGVTNAAAIVLDMAELSIPIIAGLISIWLGRGKKVKMKKGNAELELRNISETATMKIVQDFLQNETPKE